METGTMEERLWALFGITKKTVSMLEIRPEGKEKELGANPLNPLSFLSLMITSS